MVNLKWSLKRSTGHWLVLLRNLCFCLCFVTCPSSAKCQSCRGWVANSHVMCGEIHILSGFIFFFLTCRSVATPTLSFHTYHVATFRIYPPSIPSAHHSLKQHRSSRRVLGDADTMLRPLCECYHANFTATEITEGMQPWVNSTICIATANGGNSLGEEHLLACYVTGPFDVSYVPDNVSYHRHS